MGRKGGLGRGLEALIPVAPGEPDPRIPVRDVAIDRIAPNPQQPRSVMEPRALAELADSIREHGVIQPLLSLQTPDEHINAIRRFKQAIGS